MTKKHRTSETSLMDMPLPVGTYRKPNPRQLLAEVMAEFPKGPEEKWRDEFTARAKDDQDILQAVLDEVYQEVASDAIFEAAKYRTAARNMLSDKNK